MSNTYNFVEFKDKSLEEGFLQFKLTLRRALALIELVSTLYGSIQDGNLPPEVQKEREDEIWNILRAFNVLEPPEDRPQLDELFPINGSVAEQLVIMLNSVMYELVKAASNGEVEFKTADADVAELFFTGEKVSEEELDLPSMPTKKLSA